jgi:hypothetical protein
MVRGHLEPRLAHYSRQVTVAWTVFFVAMMCMSILLYLLAPISVWSAFANLATLPLVALMFIVEYATPDPPVPRHAAQADPRIAPRILEYAAGFDDTTALTAALTRRPPAPAPSTRCMTAASSASYPLLDRHDPATIVAYRHGRAISTPEFLDDVARAAAAMDAMPDARHVLNTCADRYCFASDSRRSSCRDASACCRRP